MTAEDTIDLAPLEKWLATMQGTESIEAGFIQQKFLRTLRKPLTRKGQIWLRYPDDFRWELGEPPSTIAIRNQNVLTVLEPKKKRAQRITLTPAQGEEASAITASIHSMSHSFPRTRNELEKHFDILDLDQNGEVYELVLKPDNRKLASVMRQVVFSIDKNDYHLHGFEIRFRDKSRIVTTFTRLKINPAIPAELLKPDTSGYKISERTL